MKRLFFCNYITIVICLLLMSSCEIDNFKAPDATIQGTFYDHNGKPLEVRHGASYIQSRELSWAKDKDAYVAPRRLTLQQDGTYQNTKQFAGEYLLFPIEGNFFPYWSSASITDADEREKSGIVVTLKSGSVITQDFKVTPYLTIEWVGEPTVITEPNGKYIECKVKFTRNQKTGFNRPDVREANFHVGRTINPQASRDGDYFPAVRTITNAQEGTELTFRTATPVKFTNINYYLRISMNCQTAAGDNTTNYPGMGQENYTSVKKVFVP